MQTRLGVPKNWAQAQNRCNSIHDANVPTDIKSEAESVNNFRSETNYEASLVHGPSLRILFPLKIHRGLSLPLLLSSSSNRSLFCVPLFIPREISPVLMLAFLFLLRENCRKKIPLCLFHFSGESFGFILAVHLLN